jgi:hypothetical protein
MLHFEVVWLYCTATVEKAVLPDDNFKFAVMKIFPKYTKIALLFIRIYMSVAEVLDLAGLELNLSSEFKIGKYQP